MMSLSCSALLWHNSVIVLHYAVPRGPFLEMKKKYAARVEY